MKDHYKNATGADLPTTVSDNYIPMMSDRILRMTQILLDQHLMKGK